jgi:hypothetical protein
MAVSTMYAENDGEFPHAPTTAALTQELRTRGAHPVA